MKGGRLLTDTLGWEDRDTHAHTAVPGGALTYTNRDTRNDREPLWLVIHAEWEGAQDPKTNREEIRPRCGGLRDSVDGPHLCWLALFNSLPPQRDGLRRLHATSSWTHLFKID